MLKKLLSVLLAVVLFCTVLPFGTLTSFAVQPTVTDVSVAPVDVIYHTHGNFNHYYNESSGAEYDYFEYSLTTELPLNLTVTFSDNSIITGTYDEVRQQMGIDVYSINFDDTQASTPWEEDTYYVDMDFYRIGSARVQYNVLPSPIATMVVEDMYGYVGDEHNGYIETGFDVDTNEPYSFFRYYSYPSKVTVSYTDPTRPTYIGDVTDLCSQTGYNLFTDDHQTNKTPWTTSGDYTINVSFMGYETTFTYHLQNSPIKAIHLDDIDRYENTHGHYQSNSVDGTPYFVYENTISNDITIEFNDGRPDLSCKLWDVPDYLGSENSVSWSGSQQQDEVWEIGEHEITAMLMGVSTTYYVNIIEFPIVSLQVELEKDVLYKQQDCSICYSMENNKPYAFFELYNLIKSVTPIIKPGKSTDGLNLDLYTVNSDQSETNLWDVGLHTFTVEYYGIRKEVPITVVADENPVIDITLNESIVYYENLDSFDTFGMEIDPETHMPTYEEYTRYDTEATMPSFTLKYQNGDSFTGTVEEIGYETGCYPQITSDQSARHEWKTGEQQITLVWQNIIRDFPVTVEQNPVSSIEVLNPPDKSDYILHQNYDLRGMMVRVKYKDNTYDDVELKYAILGLNDYYGYYLPKYKRMFGVETSGEVHATAEDETVELSILGEIVSVPVNVKNIWVTSATLENSGIYTYLNNTFSDGSIRKERILDFEITSHAEDEGALTVYNGVLFTDYGIYEYTQYLFAADGRTLIRISDKAAEEHSSATITTNMIPQSVYLEKCCLFSLQNIGDSFMFSSMRYDGIVTAENIDDLVRIAIFAKEFYPDENEYCTNMGYFFKGEDIRAAIFEIFGFEADLSLSQNYRADIDRIEIDYGYGGTAKFFGKTVSYENGVWQIESRSCPHITNAGEFIHFEYNEDNQLVFYEFRSNNSIKITTVPIKTKYDNLNDGLDLTGGVVTLYNDNRPIDVMQMDDSMSDGVVTIDGQQYIVVKIGECTDTFAVQIATLPGDVNGSGGEPDITDLAVLKNYLADPEGTVGRTAINPDVDGNGESDITDLALLKMFLAGVIRIE